MTPSSSRNASCEPADSEAASASGTSSAIGTGHKVPSASRISAQTLS